VTAPPTGSRARPDPVGTAADRATTVAIIEDHALLALSVASALRLEGFTVLVPDPRTALEELADTAPLVALLDLDLGPLGAGEQLLPELVARGVAVLIVSGVTDPVRLAGCVELGAVGLLAKTTSIAALMAAITAAARGEPVLDPEERDRLLRELRVWRQSELARETPFNRLSPREAHVLHELVQGRSVSAIAAASWVSTATVRTQVRAILAKLGVGTQLAAVAAARDAGWRYDATTTH
jgi:two-component system nitrate/nitrite response regulator NarL